MKRSPILNPPRSTVLEFPADNSRLFIGHSGVVEPDEPSAEVGDVFINERTGYTSVLMEKGEYSEDDVVEALSPGHVKAISKWMKATHPDTYAAINWDGDGA